jgi:hypothetical protein
VTFLAVSLAMVKAVLPHHAEIFAGIFLFHFAFSYLTIFDALPLSLARELDTIAGLRLGALMAGERSIDDRFASKPLTAKPLRFAISTCRPSCRPWIWTKRERHKYGQA